MVGSRVASGRSNELFLRVAGSPVKPSPHTDTSRQPVDSRAPAGRWSHQLLAVGSACNSVERRSHWKEAAARVWMWWVGSSL